MAPVNSGYTVPMPNMCRFNLIESRTTDNGTAPVTTDFVYNRMGNLVYDGVYWYRYDAWNRLIQIVEAPSGGFSFDGAGVKDPGGPAFADVVAVFAYDALGRLVGRQAPFPGTTDEWRTETYFYDGSRRIAERWKDPLIGNNGGGNSGFQQNQQTSYVEDTEREYVYTPGYVDEFVAEFDLGGAHWAVLQDANHNAVSLVESSTGNVARQRVLSPYGRVLQSDALITSSPLTRVGHQGLFAERIDANTLANPMQPGGTIVWHNRNRTLLSEYGRFAQRDPNGSGQGVGSASTMAGLASSTPYASLDGSSMFADGASLYAYARSSPVVHTDAAGLFIGGLLGLFAPTTGMDVYTDYNDSALDAGMSMADAIEGMISDYAAGQAWDLEWALDWDMPDDFSTHSVPASGSATGGDYYASASIPRKFRAFDKARQHGGPKHWQEMPRLYMELYKKYPSKPGTLRTNQALIGPGRTGKLSNFRPDVQWIDRNGVVNVIEVADTQSREALLAEERAYNAIAVSTGVKIRVHTSRVARP